MKIFKSIIKKNDLIFDVGANIGSKSDIFLQLGAKVVGFEPQSKCANECRKRFKGNTNFILENVALGSFMGESVLYEANVHTISSMSTDFINAVKKKRFSGYSWNKKIKVKVDTLDNMVQKYGRPKFIKIDVEGYELNVLNGLSCIPGVISIEFTPELIANSLACIERLESINKNLLFNYGYKEEDSFMYDSWVRKNRLLHHLRSIRDSKIEFGDIYVIKTGHKIS